ncbi:MAG: hypothetical protein AAGI92_08805 [Pseudomonadota bacterium]
MAEKSTIDLTSLAGLAESEVAVTVTPVEHEDDRKARLQRESWTFWVTQFWLVVVLAMLVGAAWYLTRFVVSDDAKLAEWARVGLTAILTGVISFFTGLKVGGK